MSSSAEVRRTPRGCGLPAALAADLEAVGIDLAGVLAVERYDELVPPAWQSAAWLEGARSAVVLGCGGRSFEIALAAAPGASEVADPVDTFAKVHVDRVARTLSDGGEPSRAFYYWQSFSQADDRSEPSPGFADFVALARAAGLGEPGRLRVLLHPEFGPWMAIRAVLLSTLALEPTPPLADPAPCLDCPAPCATACPGDALAAGPLDWARCFETREHEPACETRCAARHACVIGPDHAYSPRWEAHFMRSSLQTGQSMQRKAQLRS